MKAKKHKSAKYNLKKKRDLERFHIEYFDHPDAQSWKSLRSLAQPSFLKQVNSRGAAHTTPMKVIPPVPEV